MGKKFNIFNKHTYIKTVLKIFIALNFICIGYVLTSTANEPYPTEKAMMQTAGLINAFYIYPLSEVFGNRNILTLPFYFVRDKLYYTAYNMYPKDEAEKEMQWTAVRYWEYDKLYSPYYEKYFKTNPEKLIKNNVLFNWTDEIYYHLNLLSKGTIKDPDIRKLRYNAYNKIFHDYLPARSLLFKAKFNNIDIYLLDNQEIQRLKNLVNESILLEEYCKINEPEGFIYWNTDNFYYTNLNIFESTIDILQHAIKKNELTCNDFYLKTYLINRGILKAYMQNPKIPRGDKNLIYKILNYSLSNDILEKYNTQCKIIKE